MLKEDIATKILLGGLKEMMLDGTYCYVASTVRYSELRENGRLYVVELVNSVLPLIIEAENERIQEAAEKLMIKKIST